ncbi:bactofilin family protein [Ramlibacter albus]|uniref:Polymer-forming cytoskeletal protein n=1 Tax=Ramlibacter albus TaxID=2079448 RepID=A0A923S6F7_9BURK|nr:polymer-forming cytoskeletal protein [Ramlibacter albus]MBC5766102.1 polymer-forming cytoskeletal protein [Ramlibacter albus]
MALQSPFFNNKRESEATQLRNALSPNAQAVQQPQQAPAQQQPAPQPAAASSPAPVAEGESKLTIGPNIKLKGEIKDCDTLVVEGSVEATMDSRVIQISERGAFKGSAEIDIAEIRGQFDGDLTVRKKLVIYSTGKVRGRVRYGEMEVEKGGQLSGEIESGTQGGRQQPLLAMRNTSVG